MKSRTLALSLPLFGLLALGACDRRDAHPPEESRTTTDQVTPPTVEGGHVTAPDAGSPGDDRCAGLTGEALSDCTTGGEGVPMILGEDGDQSGRDTDDDRQGDAPAQDNRSSDRNQGQ